MCYAIPGRIDKISGGIVTLDYFGEKRKARNDFFALGKGDYVYAQGGFIIRKVSRDEAEEVLKTWRELFFKLQKTDLRLASLPKDLRQRANSIRQKHLGNSCCVHGILEFSNNCINDCLYCGLRRSNASLKRYRMSADEIVGAALLSIDKLKFKALVLQSGEDPWYDEKKLVYIVENIMKNSPALIILSIGEREFGIYESLYEAGARGALMRFETSSRPLYAKMRPGHILKDRIRLIKKLRDKGYLVMSGFLIGLPGQSDKDIINDIELTASLSADMFSFGPFIPHPQTPLSDAPAPGIEKCLDIVAKVRIMNTEARILVTTSVEALGGKGALRKGLLAGGNSLMVNVTPEKYKALYDIYPRREDSDKGVQERIDFVLKLLNSIGRAPVDIGLYIPGHKTALPSQE